MFGRSKYPNLELLGIDRDDAALAKARERLAFAGGRVRLVRGNYSELAARAAEAGWEKVDGILLDIGVSSPQLDQPERGFSWRADGPLDMRMDRRSILTASRLLNTAPEAELERILREYGEVAKSRKLAAAIVTQRVIRPFAMTSDFVSLCDEVLGKSRPGQLPAPTLPFQALRIAVNDELGELRRALEGGLRLLRPGGRLAVITFESLSDRETKRFFQAHCGREEALQQGGSAWRGETPRTEWVLRKAVTARPEELAANPRARSAKLRAVRKAEG